MDERLCVARLPLLWETVSKLTLFVWLSPPYIHVHLPLPFPLVLPRIAPTPSTLPCPPFSCLLLPFVFSSHAFFSVGLP